MRTEVHRFESASDPDDPERVIVLKNLLPLGADGRWIAVSLEGLWIWNRAGQCTKHIPTPTCLDNGCLAISPSARLAATSRARRGLALYDLDKECLLETLEGSQGEIRAAVFIDECRLVAGSGSAMLLWDLVDQRFTQLDPPAAALDYSATTGSLAIAGVAGYVGVYTSMDAPLLVWQRFLVKAAPTTRDRLSSDQRAAVGIVWNRPGVTMRHARLSPDGRQLLTGGCDDALHIWDAKSGEEMATLTGHDFWIDSLSVHPSGHWALTCSADWTIRLWDIANHRCHRIWKLDGRPNGVAFSADGTAFCTIEEGNTIVSRPFKV